MLTIAYSVSPAEVNIDVEKYLFLNEAWVNWVIDFENWSNWITNETNWIIQRNVKLDFWLRFLAGNYQNRLVRDKDLTVL